MTYRSFFSTAFDGDAEPFAYQQALADSAWPDALIAPTGLGKTAAVALAWLWKLATIPSSVPRRLVYCLPMRTLADQTQRNVINWLQRLASLPGNIAPRLPDPKRDVQILMGGVNEPAWHQHPERPAILIGTQDLLLSRALMRGYAMSRFRWPVDFALLHNDAQWVFDEVQLMGSGLATSTQLEAFRRRFETVSPADSLWVSATLHTDWLRTVDTPSDVTVWRVPDDFPADDSSARVRALLDAPKPISRLPVMPATARKLDVDAYARSLSDEILSMHQPETVTLVILNTVSRAQQVHAALAAQVLEPDRLALIHSRFRSGDRAAQMGKLPDAGETRDLIVVATQAVEAGVDLSAATLFTELAPASSLVQRFGRVNRYGELNEHGGGTIRWIDLVDESLAPPYQPQDLATARRRATSLRDARPSNLSPPDSDDCRPRSVIRAKDLIDLYDTDSDLTGFDVDISPYIRDADDTDVHVFWRDFDFSSAPDDQPAPSREELCAVPIGRARDWIRTLRAKRIRAYREDPQAGRRARGSRHVSWMALDGAPWPGLVLMLHSCAGGYSPATGFDERLTAPVEPVSARGDAATQPMAESLDTDPDSERGALVPLVDHLQHVASEAKALCETLEIPASAEQQVLDAARWHDLGKSHQAFQERLLADEDEPSNPAGPYAKAPRYDVGKGRRHFRHELASALAYLAHCDWSRDGDLIAFLIAAHHGKVRMNLRALPAERPPTDAHGRPTGARFARGIWESDVLPEFDLGDGTHWTGGTLSLSVMELGHDAESGSSWAERVGDLLAHYGPFRLAWMEAMLRIADWRASGKEERSEYD